MSLGHLYLDLNILGIYPDLIVSIGSPLSGNIPYKDVDHELHNKMFENIHIHLNRYYGPELYNTHIVLFNETMAWVNKYTSDVIKFGVNRTFYEVDLLSVKSMIVKCGKKTKKMDWGYRSSIFGKMLMARYREIVDLDSLCKVIEDIVMT